MSEPKVSVAEAKKHLSKLLGRVAFGKEHIIITKRGIPIASLVPAEKEMERLAEAIGWLDNGDEFFETMDRIVLERRKRAPRAMTEDPVGGGSL